MAPVTKSITATAVMRLNELRKVSLNKPVNDYLGQEKVYSPMWNPRGATVRRLLSHTSGVTTFARSCSPGESSRSEEHTSELQSHSDLVCRLLLEKKKNSDTIS